MPARRTRRFRQTDGTTYRIKNRRGEYLHDASTVPFEWVDREPMALAFRSREAAERFVSSRFVSATAARELLGVHVVG